MLFSILPQTKVQLSCTPGCAPAPLQSFKLREILVVIGQGDRTSKDEETCEDVGTSHVGRHKNHSSINMHSGLIDGDTVSEVELPRSKPCQLLV
jgi:hypothetical protein